jgi:hypothetical protein
VGKNIVTCVKVAVFVVLSSKDLLGVLNKIEGAKGISQGVLDGQTCSRNGVVRVVVPRKSIPMCNRKERHLKADESVLDGSSKIVRVVAWHIVWNSPKPNEYRQEEALPIRCEDDALDAQELGHRAEGLQILRHAHPEHSQSIQTNGDADVVDDTTPEVA